MRSRALDMIPNMLACFVLPALVFSLAPPLVAAPPGDRLVDRVAEAYQKTDQYHATLDYTLRRDADPWHEEVELEIYIAYDREGQRLVIDKPTYRMVVTGGVLRLRSEEFPGRHLEIDAPSPLTYEALDQVVPQLAGPPLPDVAFLLADDPVAALARGAGTARTAEGEQGLRLDVPTPEGTLALRLDDESRLVTQVSRVVDMTGRAEPGVSMVERYEVKLHRHNEPLEDAVFAFDTTDSVAVGSLQALTQPAVGGAGGTGAGGGGGNAGGGGGGAGASGGEAGGHPLQGQAAPPLELESLAGESYELAEEEAELVVLGFWAGWMDASLPVLQAMEALHERAESKDGVLKVVSVNVMDSAERAAAVAEAHGLTHPILVDVDGEVLEPYQVVTVPQMFLIRDGEVIDAYDGHGQAVLDRLRADVEEQLEALDD